MALLSLRIRFCEISSDFAFLIRSTLRSSLTRLSKSLVGNMSRFLFTDRTETVSNCYSATFSWPSFAPLLRAFFPKLWARRQQQSHRFLFPHLLVTPSHPLRPCRLWRMLGPVQANAPLFASPEGTLRIRKITRSVPFDLLCLPQISFRAPLPPCIVVGKYLFPLLPPCLLSCDSLLFRPICGTCRRASADV